MTNVVHSEDAPCTCMYCVELRELQAKRPAPVNTDTLVLHKDIGESVLGVVKG